MSAKNESKVPAPAPQASRQELEYLYARRSAIDSLIESLEKYARSGSAQGKTRESQTA